MPDWENITALGGLPFTGLAALAIACALMTANSRPWRALLWWCGLFSAALAVAAASQIAFFGWGIGIERIAFAGVSGHAIRAATVFPVALLVVFGGVSNVRRHLALFAGFGMAALVAASRVLIGAHSVSEASAGLVLGSLMAAVFISRVPVHRAHAAAIPLMVLCMAASFSTVQPDAAAGSTTHQWLIGIALNLSGRDRPYSRIDWKPTATPYIPPCAIDKIRLRYLCM